jgi:formate-dependent phosphoribosylglycinamide formyltransferase (GAR transformylase)
MAGKRILILGGNRYNLLSIQAARSAGFFTLVADRNANAPGLAIGDVGLAIDLNDGRTLLEGVRARGGVDGVVSLNEVGVRTAAWLCRQLALPSISEASAANATSKARMRECWQELGSYSVPFRVVSSEQAAGRAAGEIGYPVVFKPDRSHGGSRGVIRVDGPAEVASAYAFARSGALDDREIVVEPLLVGREYSAEVLIWQGMTSVLCVGRNMKGAYPFHVNTSIRYPAVFSLSEETRVADMCDRAVKALGLTQGVAHIEFSWTGVGPVMLELGARCGGGHIPQIAHHVSGVNEFVEACRIACGLPPARFRPVRRGGAEYRFLILPPGPVDEVMIPDEVVGHPGILDAGATLARSSVVSSLRSTADRAGFVVALAETSESAVELGDWACGRISVRYDNGKVAAPLLFEDTRPPWCDSSADELKACVPVAL